MKRPKVFVTKELKEETREAMELAEISNILLTDLRRVVKTADAGIAQYKDSPDLRLLNELEIWMRLSIRLLITEIEAVCFKLKQMALIGHEIRKKPLADEDIIKMTEKKGKNPFYMRTADNLKYAVKMFAATYDSTYTLKFGKEWAVFKKVLRKRNGFTHPKSKVDLAVSITDYNGVEGTGIWFGNIIKDLKDLIPKS